MAEELKLIPHDDGLLTLFDDPTWSREYPGWMGRRVLAMIATVAVLTALVAAGLFAAGVIATVGMQAGFMVGAIVAAPLVLVNNKASWALHIGHVGLTVTRVFGNVRTSEVMDGVANTKPARLGTAVEPRTILWEDVDDVVWSDVHLDVRHSDGEVLRFDLEDYARDDIARLGEEIRKVWQRTEPSRGSEEQAEASREQLQRLAKGRQRE